MMRFHGNDWRWPGRLGIPAGVVLVLGLCFAGIGSGDTKLGIFEGNGDIGTVLHPGSATYDAANGIYTVAGSGENMWSTKDGFRFVWKKASGDNVIRADVGFLGEGTNPHRKAVVIIRQSLDPDSPYVDIALHGVGLTSLQYREEKGASTHEIQASISAPRTLQLEKHGDYFSMLLGVHGGEPQVAGGSIRALIHGEYYIGIGVCSHEKDIVEKAVFSNVNIHPPSAATAQATLYSTLETITH